MQEQVYTQGQWYRIASNDGEVDMVAVPIHVVQRAAKNNFGRPQEVISEGRFFTPFAEYSTFGNLTEVEKSKLAPEPGE